MNATIEEIVDRPPAGTACATCRAMGHYCPAKAFKGMTDVGLCEPCLREENCPAIAAIQKRDTVAYVDRPERVPAPVRVVPREEWPTDTAIHETKHAIADVPFGLRNVVREQVREDRAIAAAKPVEPVFTNSAERVWLKDIFPTSALYFETFTDEEARDLKAIADLAPAVSWFVEEKVGDNWKIVLEDPIFFGDREAAKNVAMALADVIDSQEARIMCWRKTGEDLPPLQHYGKRRGRPPGANYKQPQREKAKELLQRGVSVRDTAEAVGLSKTKVLEVRKETPDVPPPPPGGMPMHKEKVMDQKTPQQLAEESYAMCAKGMLEVAQKFRDAGVELPDPLQRALNEPITLPQLEILRPQPAPRRIKRPIPT